MQKMRLKCFILLLFIYLQWVLCEESKTIELDKEVTQSLDKTLNAFFKLKIPSTFSGKQNFLILKVSPNEELDRKYNMLSDPNIYVSDEVESPSRDNCRWKSERVGEEIISVDYKYIKPDKEFYVSVYCPEHCNFILKAQLAESFNIKENTIYGITLNEGETVKLEFTSREKYKDFSLNIIGLEMRPFRAYLSNENPSSSNSFDSVPIYTNGYKFIVKEGTSYYKSNSVYQVLLENKGGKNNLRIWLKYEHDEIYIREYDYIFDSMGKNEKNCYSFEMDVINKDKDMIISSTIFNGDGYLRIGGWKEVKENDIKDLPRDKDTFNLKSDKVIKLSQDDLKRYGKPGIGDSLHFCFFSDEPMSYSLKVYYFENSPKMQKLNNLFPGLETKDILPSNTMTSFRLMDFEVKKDLLIYLENTYGKAVLYGYFCTEADCTFNSTSFASLVEKEKIVIGFKVFEGQEIVLRREMNKCMQYKGDECKIIAGVRCEEGQDCIYEIGFDHSDTEVPMRQKISYSNVLTEKEIDRYSIAISDDNIRSITVVLTQNTGRSELTITGFSSFEGKDYTLKKKKLSKDYMPNVLELKSNDIGVDSLKGKIYVEVKGLSFASYSILYYPFNEYKSKELDHKNVLMGLSKGRIIEDFFWSEHYIKVYSYENIVLNTNKSDLYISLTKMNLDCSVYVFDDLDKFSVKNNLISGYLWSNDYNNMIQIKKDDPNYISNGYLYIMVVQEQKDGMFKKPTFSSFYLVVTDETTPILLTEGVQQRYSLTHFRSSQSFYFSHASLLWDLELSLAVFAGRVRIEVDLGAKPYIYQTTVSETHFLHIPSEDIRNFCVTARSCGIDIRVKIPDDYLWGADFLIVAQSGYGSPVRLIPGIVDRKDILPGQPQYFIIETVPDPKLGIRINTMFTKGRGEIYVRRAGKDEDEKDLQNYPTNKHYEYSNTDKYSVEGQYIHIPYKDVSSYTPCKLFLTVEGFFPGYDSNRIEYSISVSSEINELLVDKAYRLYISTGEVQMYHFTVKGNKRRIYISMTNKDEDADLYLNYGQNPPQVKKSLWKSLGANNEYLDLTIEDSFFQQNKLEFLDGEYFLAVQGLGDTFYNLYISSLDVKMQTLSENYPAGCNCAKKGDSCFFRYENINDPKIIIPVAKNVLFYADYTYGSGKIYGNLYPSGDISEIFRDLPSSRKSMYSSEGRYEFLNVRLEEGERNYTINSVIVLRVECEEESLFDFNVISMKSKRSYIGEEGIEYLSLNKDNIYYISPSTPPIILSFYSFKDSEISFGAKALGGEAKVSVYSNESYWGDGQKGYKSLYEFSVSEEEKDGYFNSIKKEDAYARYVSFKVQAKKDCLFYINLHYTSEFVRLPIEKLSKNYVYNGDFYGYFDFLEAFTDVLLTVSSPEKSSTISVYAKINIVDYGEGNKKYKYSIPSENNFDFKGKTNSVLSAVSFRIKNVPEKTRKGKKVRVLINVQSDKYFDSQQINIMIMPQVQHLSRAQPVQRTYYYSSLRALDKDKTVYSLTRNKPEDDLMVIEISSCQGDFDYVITKDSPDVNAVKVESNIKVKHGKKVITINKIDDSTYYLSVVGTQEGDICLGQNQKNCNKDVDLLMYYYTTTSNKYLNTLMSTSYINYVKNGDGEVTLNLPNLVQRDSYGNDENAENINFSVIVTDNKEEFKYLESTCYLTRRFDQIQNQKLFPNIVIKVNKLFNKIYISGLKNGKSYFANVLVTNLRTGEILTLQPIQIEIDSEQNSKKNILLIVICVVIVFALAFFFYRRYKAAQGALRYEMGTLPKSIRELKNVPKVVGEIAKKKDKYDTLTDEAGNV